MESPVILEDAASMRQYSRDARHQGRTIGLVPTMGSLHEGHLSLIDGARCDLLHYSDAVLNGWSALTEMQRFGTQQTCRLHHCLYLYQSYSGQFAQHEDFGVYPREQERDIQLVKQYNVDAVFMPKSLYARGQSDGSNADAGVVVGAKSTTGKQAYQTFVQVEELQQPLCGQSRPHFFRGVATVVAKLFNIVEPDVALFGRKDFQQFLVLSTMAQELDFPVKVIGMPIVREKDGLAMSSRNKLLSQDDRQRALCISKALKWASQSIASGTCTAGKELHDSIAQQISEAGGRVDYVEVVNAHTLEPVEHARNQPTLIAVAAFFGMVRLIDNLEVP